MLYRFASLILLSLPLAASAQWTEQSPQPTGLGVTGVAFTSPTDGWLATGGSSWDGPGRRALLETRDGGASWTHRMIPENDDHPLNGIQFIDAQHGWAFGNSSYRTTDGGVTWEPLPFLGTTSSMHFYTRNFGTAHGNFGFATSLDGGLNWSLSAEGPRSFDFRDDDHGLGISASAIYRTTDGGATFSPVYASGGPAVLFLTDDAAVAIAGGQFLISDDDGQNWTDTAPATGRNRLLRVSDHVLLAWHESATVPNPDGRLLRSSDGGQTWTDLGIIFSRGTGSFAVVDDETVVAVDAAGDVFRSADAGLTWSLTYDTPFVGFGSHYLSFVDGGHGWLAYGYGAIFETTDGGITWTQASNGYGADLEDLVLISPLHLVAVGGGGAILLTEDGGITWELIDDDIETAHDLVAVQAITETLLVSITEHGVVVRSEDGGRSWEQAGPRPDPSVEFRAYDLHFRTRDEGWVVGTRFNLPAVYHTLDGGETWASRPYPGLWIAIDFHDDHGWILDNRGPLLRTTDGGQSWTSTNLPLNHLPEIELTDIKFFDESTGYVTGWVGYVAKSTDGGQTWTLLNTGTLSHIFTSIHLVSADEVWLSTTNDLVYRSVNGGATWDVMSVGSAPLATGSFTAIAADETGNAWVAGFKGHIYSRLADPVSAEPVAGTAAGGLSITSVFPNPVRSAATVELTLSMQQDVIVEVFDVLGRRVAMLHRGVLSPQEDHRLTFDAGALPSGIYLIQARSGGDVASARVTVLR